MNFEEMLLSVQRPGRYTGGEWNSVKKEWGADTVKFLLAFPDVYEVGMSYLGAKILYGVLNNREDCVCERVYSPWPDFEKVLRENGVSLFSLESRSPIKKFDIIGFSITYELNYTNVINILDLGDIPKRSCERSDRDPIVIAGGTSCYNPEPMAEFIDAFVIGDGEEAIADIVETYKAARHSVPAMARSELLKALSGITGVYVPSLYNVEYNDDGSVRRMVSKDASVPVKIRKRVIGDLNTAFYPVRQIVPNIQIVHDRIVLEIMRGCKHACRFCQATSTYRPCRQRDPATLLKLAKESYARTGYDEISLLSLSSVDYPQIRELIMSLNDEFGKKGVSISVPSLRVEGILKDLPVLLAKVKKSGLTFAPEAGSERLRTLIGKDIKIDELSEAALASFRNGWNRVKLYFMIGLPTEEDEDLSGIVELILMISNLRKEVDGKAANVTASINPFVPKPHTPFQLQTMDDIDTLERKRRLILKMLRDRTGTKRFIELDFHSFKMSYLEAVLSRGDRRLSSVIFGSWKAGARFDSWQDHFNYDTWLKSFEDAGIDPGSYVLTRRGPDGVQPWSFIDLGLPGSYFSSPTAGITGR